MNNRTSAAFIRALLLTAGVFHLAIGLTMLFAPVWFYDNIGTYPPYNRHYVGDLGAFQLPLGLALLWALRNPRRHHLVIGSAVLGNALHTLNHAYDDALLNLLPTAQTLSLFAFTVMLTLAWVLLLRQQESDMAQEQQI